MNNKNLWNKKTTTVIITIISIFVVLVLFIGCMFFFNGGHSTNALAAEAAETEPLSLDYDSTVNLNGFVPFSLSDIAIRTYEEKYPTEPTEDEDILLEEELNPDAEITDAPSTSGSGKRNAFDRYVGRFKIPSVGVNVGCYHSNSQATADAIDSAAYFYISGHYTIADHNNQGFNAIKRCSVGTKATFTTGGGTKNFTCIAKIQGHNTGHGLTDSSWNSIDGMYPGTLVAYTCNENWQNITIVFFDGDDLTGTVEGEPMKECPDDQHDWGEWEIIEYVDELYGPCRIKRSVCRKCQLERWEDFEILNQKDDDVNDNGGQTEPAETEPVETEPSATEPPVTEPSVVEPEPTESGPAPSTIPDDGNDSNSESFNE